MYSSPSNPLQSEHISAGFGDADLDGTIVALDAGGDLVALPLEHDPPSRRFGQLVETPPGPAEELLQVLLRDVSLVDSPALNGGLERKENQLRGEGLGEDTGRRRLVGLGRQEVGGRVASAAGRVRKVAGWVRRELTQE